MRTLFDSPAAHARATDPATSHEAAASISRAHVTAAQDAILISLRMRGPMTDEAIYEVVSKLIQISPSGCRTRRAELVDAGKVIATGFGETARGRKCQIWSAVP